MRAPGGIGGRTHVAGIIGWPVEHSLSPAIHNAAFAHLNLDWVYVPLPVSPGSVPDAVAGVRALGLAGANVTMPHKAEVASLVDARSDDAQRLDAVNTLVVTEDTLEGHNTDAPGFARFLERDAGFSAEGATVLVYGAGGAARACALAVARAGAAALVTVLRDPSRSGPLRRTMEGIDTEVRAVPFDAVGDVQADLVVNATPLGGAGERLPLPVLGPEVSVVDLLYHPATTPLLEAAKEAGSRAFGGIGLLLQQAALSFELWTGRPAPLGVMSAAALAALADRV
jgi:shikimate dehydrogenase